MILPRRKYYPLHKAAKEVECDIDDLLHYASMGILQLCVHININGDDAFSDCYINSDIDDDLLESLQKEVNPAPLIWSTDMNYISEDADFLLLSLSDECGSKINNAIGWFAINNTELIMPEFEETGEIEAFTLVHLREHLNMKNKYLRKKTSGYNPGLIMFYQPKKFTINDFCITSPELELLKSGGGDLLKFAFMKNPEESAIAQKKIGAKTINGQSEFIKSLLYLLYSDEELIENPRKFIDNHDSDIVKDFDAKGLKLPTGKTIAAWLKNVDLPIKK